MTSKDLEESLKIHTVGFLKVREQYPQHSPYTCMCTYFIGRPTDESIIRHILKTHVDLSDHPGETEDEMVKHVIRLTTVRSMEFNSRRYGR